MRRAVWTSLILATCSFAGCADAPTMPEAEQGRAVADKFMNLVRSGKAAQAWDETSVEFKSAEGKESFVRSVKKRSWLAKPTNFDSVKTTTNPLGDRAEYCYRSADNKHQVRLLIGHSGTDWCVDRIQID